MKQVSTHDLTFDSHDLGVLIMEGNSSSENFSDPQATAQHVGSSTGDTLMLLATNTSTHEVWYNDLHLGTDISVA